MKILVTGATGRVGRALVVRLGLQHQVLGLDRAPSSTAHWVGDLGDATLLRRWTESQAGVTLGIGLGMSTAEDPAGDGFLRVAHMGHVNAHMTLGALAVMEAGLRALGIPHGPGAVEAAAAVVAGR